MINMNSAAIAGTGVALALATAYTCRKSSTKDLCESYLKVKDAWKGTPEYKQYFEAKKEFKQAVTDLINHGFSVAEIEAYAHKHLNAFSSPVVACGKAKCEKIAVGAARK